MNNPEDSENFEELDNLLSDQYIAFGRARELVDDFGSVCELERQILQDNTADPVISITPPKSVKTS